MTLSAQRAITVALVLCAACATPNPAPTREPARWQPTAEEKAKAAVEPAASEKSAGEKPSDTADKSKNAAIAAEPVVARVAGRPIYVSELLSQWLYLDNFRVRDQLLNLATSRIVLAEAQRLRVTIDADTSSTAYEKAVAAIENELKNSKLGRKDPDITLDAYVRRELALDPIRYRERLRDDALRALLGDRVTRAWLLEQEHAELHVIVVGSETELEAVQQDLAGGKSFEEVARTRSADPSKKDGGAITPIVRSSTPLSKAAFDAPIGTVGGPITDAGAWLLFRVDARPKPLEGDWTRIGATVEESLKKRPVDQYEVQQWHVAMRSRYEVDLSPFQDLVGENSR